MQIMAIKRKSSSRMKEKAYIKNVAKRAYICANIISIFLCLPLPPLGTPPPIIYVQIIVYIWSIGPRKILSLQKLFRIFTALRQCPGKESRQSRNPDSNWFWVKRRAWRTFKTTITVILFLKHLKTNQQ